MDGLDSAPGEAFYMNEFTRVVVTGGVLSSATSLKIYSRGGFLANRYVWILLGNGSPIVSEEKKPFPTASLVTTLGETGNPFEFFDPQIEIDSPPLGGMFVTADLAPSRSSSRHPHARRGGGATGRSPILRRSSNAAVSHRYVEEILVEVSGARDRADTASSSYSDEEEIETISGEEVVVEDEERSVTTKRPRLHADDAAMPLIKVIFKVKRGGGTYDPDAVVREMPSHNLDTATTTGESSAVSLVPIQVRRASAVPRYRNQLQRNLALCDQEGLPREWIYTETSVDPKGGAPKCRVKMFSSYVKAVDYYLAKLQDIHRLGAGPKGLFHDGECQLQFRGFSSSKPHCAEITIRALADIPHDPVYRE